MISILLFCIIYTVPGGEKELEAGCAIDQKTWASLHKLLPAQPGSK